MHSYAAASLLASSAPRLALVTTRICCESGDARSGQEVNVMHFVLRKRLALKKDTCALTDGILLCLYVMLLEQ